MRKRLNQIGFLLFALLFSISCTGENKPMSNAPASGESTVKVKLQTSLGDIVLELDQAKAPITTENFVRYVNEGFYKGTIFHRVIPGFMAQGGGFTESFEQKSTHAPIQNEANNGLANDRGTIAMARTPDPHSGSSQFFINFSDNGFLNFSSETMQGWGYAVFGKVVEGMEVVDSMAEIPTGSGGPMPTDVPQTTILIKEAIVLN